MLNLGLTTLLSIVIILVIVLAVTTPFWKTATQKIPTDQPAKSKK